ncbi:MAG: hypothetical protein AB1442_12880 [Nitrospirota bacterium]
MRKTLVLLAVVAIIAIGTFVYAQEAGTMGGGQGQQGWYCPNCGQWMGPGMMGRGMMGGGMMGGGMMGGGMMGGGMMGRGMMGSGMMTEECQKFLNDTSGDRKKIADKRFEYFEAMRNPKTTPETAGKLEKEIYDMQQKLYMKTPQGCMW